MIYKTSESELYSTPNLPLKERIRLAKEHMKRHRQLHEVLWPYQQFSITIGELLDAAEHGIK